MWWLLIKSMLLHHIVGWRLNTYLHRISILIRVDDCTINLEILSLLCLFLFPFRDAEHKNLMNWIKLNCEGGMAGACWRRTNWLFTDGNSRWCHEFQAPASTGHTWLQCYCAPLVLIEKRKWIFCGQKAKTLSSVLANSCHKLQPSVSLNEWKNAISVPILEDLRSRNRKW